MKKPFISIILINYKNIKPTVKCINSILNSHFKDYEIILLDNYSNNGSYEKLTKLYNGHKKINIICSSENLGFAEGNNFASNFAKGEYIFLLNNDAEVNKNTLNLIKKYLNSEDSKKYSLFGLNDIKKDISKIRMNILGYHIYEKEPAEPFYIVGFGLLYRKKEIAIPFDKDYFLYGEDVYLSWKMRLLNKKIKLLENISIKHEGSKSVGNKSKTFIYYGERNRIMNLLIFYSYKTLIYLLPLLFLEITTRQLINSILLKKDLIYKMKAHLWILFHLNKILRKRRDIQKKRIVSDKEILRFLSKRLFRRNTI